MRKTFAVFAAALCAAADMFAATIDLSALTGDWTLQNGDIATGTLAGNYKIAIADGATVGLRDVAISGTNDDDYRWAGISCLGNATIILEGENSVKGFFNEYPGIHVPVGKTLTIKGGGALTASSNGWGAGIGGGYGIGCGNIEILWGSVTAIGGTGAAGIGGGEGQSEQLTACGSIRIYGCSVTATGGDDAPGIGGGSFGTCDGINIPGGIVVATGGVNAPGIGSGASGSCSQIDIGNSSYYPHVVATCGSACNNPVGAGSEGTVGLVYIKSSLTSSTSGATRTIRSVVDLSALTGDTTLQFGQTATGTLAGNYKIAIADGATIWLENATINGRDDDEAYPWAGLTCLGDATIILTGDNSVKGFNWGYPGIHVPQNKTLTIDGEGALSASCNGFAAGIGGGEELACGNIVVNSGTVSATGHGSAGIGGGYSAACGRITINGGTVTAQGGDSSAGLGAGYKGSCAGIVLNGGRVTASASYGSAGIGGSYEGSCGNITIGADVARVVATCGGECDNPVGAGVSGTCGSVAVDALLGDVVSVVAGGKKRTIKPPVDLSALIGNTMISDGDVITGMLGGDYFLYIADGATVELRDAAINGKSGDDFHYNWAGLTCYGDATIILTGTNVVKAFHEDYPGIQVPEGRTLTIKGDGALTASGYNPNAGYAAGIGAVYGKACGSIVIEGGTITATGGMYAAGIGGAASGACGSIVIEGGAITATGGSYAAGIGAGEGGTCESIAVRGGRVAATGGSSAAGIGSGRNAVCGSIEIGSDIVRVVAMAGANCDNAIGAGAGDSASAGVPLVATGLYDTTSGRTRTIRPFVDLAALTGDLILEDGDCAVGTLGGIYKVSIVAGATVAISNAVIRGENYWAARWAGLTCLGDATIVLKGNNEIRGFYEAYPGIYIPENHTLTITGDGSIVASSSLRGAGIGGGDELNGGNIVIAGGTVTAMGGGSAAGIGGGRNASCGTIRITGGDVHATGGTTGGSGAGIGSGSDVSSGGCGDITISGGTVEATGGYLSAGIGSGSGGSCGDITIGPGIVRVTATRGNEDGFTYETIGAGCDGTSGTVSVAEGLADSTRGRTRTIKPAVDLAALTGDLILEDGDCAVGTLGGSYRISIADGATVTIRDVAILGEHDDAWTWAGLNCLGDATIILEGANVVRGFHEYYPGIHVPAGKTLTIRGSGSLEASTTDYGAGIGGGHGISCGNIVLEGGVIVATGGDDAAGIGSGLDAACGTISIGPDVVRVVATHGSDCENPIGAGVGGTCGAIEVASGLSDLTSISTRTILSGNLALLTGDATFSDGTVLTGTLAGSYKISIADGATVTLSNAVVNANGESSTGTKWAGLTCEGDAEIVLADDESVITSFSGNYPGIYVPTNHTMTITGEGYLTVTGGVWSAGIGGGNGNDRGADASCGSIVIDLEEGAWIDATGGAFSAGIGGGFDSACGDITIRGGGVFAYGGVGIGSGGRGAGGRGTCGDITISGGDIKAEGDAGGAGIGSGNLGICGNITISGGSVMATGGTGAAGIGSGSGSGGGGETSAGCGNIAITGGEVEATGGAGAAGIGTGQGSYCYGVTVGSGIESVTATRGDAVTVGQQEYAGDPIGSGVDGDGEPVAIAPELDDETTPDGSTRTLSGSSWPAGSYEAWVRAQGLTGADAEPDATPAKWGGRWANAFVYTFGEGLVDGTAVLMSISFDADSKPVITTAPVVEGHDYFSLIVVGASVLDDWDDVVELESDDEDENKWTLAGDDEANFFRVRLE